MMTDTGIDLRMGSQSSLPKTGVWYPSEGPSERKGNYFPLVYLVNFSLQNGSPWTCGSSSLDGTKSEDKKGMDKSR